MLDLLSMGLLGDEVSDILLHSHLRGGGESGHGLRDKELGVGLQTGKSADIRQRLVLAMRRRSSERVDSIHSARSLTMGRSRPTIESAVRFSLEDRRVA